MQASNTSMPSRSDMTELTRNAIRNHRTMFLIQGVVMVILGILAVAEPMVATLAVEIFVGWLFVIGGIVRLVATFRAHATPGYWWSILIGVLAIIVGLILVAKPFQGILTLTMVLIAMFLIEGIFQIVAGFEFRRALASSWVWMVLSGVVDIVLAVLIFAGWPGTAAWAIGLLVGINLIFAGIALTMTAMAADKLPA
jgi:uncharacterized membrane protein HdeD (DUF308 family)